MHLVLCHPRGAFCGYSTQGPACCLLTCVSALAQLWGALLQAQAQGKSRQGL